MNKFNKLIDHTILKPEATIFDIEKICEEAKNNNFMSVCINPSWVKTAAKLLEDSSVKICTVIGFPLGSNTIETKVFETEDAIKNGAQEIDMVINIGELKADNFNKVQEEIQAVVNASHPRALVKVIIETCLLSKEEIVKVCELAIEAKADFVKTSTGFSNSGATVEDVELMRKTVGTSAGVKASGGVRTVEDANKMIEAGASRLGTSNGTTIISEVY